MPPPPPLLAPGEVLPPQELEELLPKLVEEEEDLNHALAARLRRAGYLLQSTFDSLSSLQRTGFHRTDLVLVDLVQPGPAAFAHLLEFLPLKRLARAPIDALSISDDAETLAEAERLGVSRVVLKPLDHQELLEAIRAALAETDDPA